MKDIRRRRRQEKLLKKELNAVPSDLEKIYGKDIDEFLNDSDWDIDSIAGPSTISHGTNQSIIDNRLRGLESIYLQRLETTMQHTRKTKQ